MISNQMTIAPSGMFSINKKLTDTKKYESSLINVRGNVTIFESMASGFSKTSYLYYNNLIFSESPEISIYCSGKFAYSEHTQVVYELYSPSTPRFKLFFQGNSSIGVQLGLNVLPQLTINNLHIEEGANFISTVKFNNENCKITILIDGDLYTKEANFGPRLNIASYKTINIGNTTNDLEDFWVGSIDLSTFSISEGNNNVVYTPSVNYPLVFSKILISDGDLPLTNKTLPVANHIYSYPVESVLRSGNSILVTTQIDGESKLVVREIGLYIKSGDKDVLFSSVSGLKINKGKDVPYTLTFTLNTYLNVVNVTGFPTPESFILNDPKYFLYKYLEDLKKLHLYIFTNVERIVAKNALNIGYNKAQVFYKLQQERGSLRECCNTLQIYSSVFNNMESSPRKLLNFYNFIGTGKASYDIYDICNTSRRITFNADVFSGDNADLLNFAEGRTVSLKVTLKGSNPKLILAKVDKNAGNYFCIYYINSTLYAVTFTQSAVAVLSKDISTQIASLESSPFLLTITKRPNHMEMFINNTLVSTLNKELINFKNFKEFKLTNSPTTENLINIYNSVNMGSSITLDYFVSSLQENTGVYIQDLFIFSGSLSSTELEFLTNLTNTNF